MEVNTLSEAETIRLAQHGNQDAFGTLYQRHLDAIYRYVHKRVGQIDEAENLTQIVFVKAWQALERYQPSTAPFRAWLYRIARNAVVDYYRSQKETLLWEDLTLISDGHETPDELLLSDERSELVRKAMTQLKPSYQEVLTHRFLDSMDYPETAQKLGRKVNAVRVLQHRALQALQKVLVQQPISWSIIGLLIIALGLGRGVVIAADDALPGDSVYPVKTALEDMWLLIADDTSDIALLSQYSDERVQEIDGLIANDRFADIPLAIDRFIGQVENAAQILADVDIQDSAKASRLTDQLSKVFTEQSRKLNAVNIKTGTEESSDILVSIQAAVDAIKRMQHSIDELTPENSPPKDSMNDEPVDSAGSQLDSIPNHGKETSHDLKVQQLIHSNAQPTATRIATPLSTSETSVNSTDDESASLEEQMHLETAPAKAKSIGHIDGPQLVVGATNFSKRRPIKRHKDASEDEQQPSLSVTNAAISNHETQPRTEQRAFKRESRQGNQLTLRVIDNSMLRPPARIVPALPRRKGMLLEGSTHTSRDENKRREKPHSSQHQQQSDQLLQHAQISNIQNPINTSSRNQQTVSEDNRESQRHHRVQEHLPSQKNAKATRLTQNNNMVDRSSHTHSASLDPNNHARTKSEQTSGVQTERTRSVAQPIDSQQKNHPDRSESPSPKTQVHETHQENKRNSINQTHKTGDLTKSDDEKSEGNRTERDQSARERSGLEKSSDESATKAHKDSKGPKKESRKPHE
ncbi:sigma-70 family RNA polymerase sigma factor [Chloroflexi bacterium TSY]|nr:sigma-70 family RNA polymerase sigma factor [Chloroflexi bacterium TSY]